VVPPLARTEEVATFVETANAFHLMEDPPVLWLLIVSEFLEEMPRTISADATKETSLALVATENRLDSSMMTVEFVEETEQHATRSAVSLTALLAQSPKAAPGASTPTAQKLVLNPERTTQLIAC